VGRLPHLNTQYMGSALYGKNNSSFLIQFKNNIWRQNLITEPVKVLTTKILLLSPRVKSRNFSEGGSFLFCLEKTVDSTYYLYWQYGIFLWITLDVVIVKSIVHLINRYIFLKLYLSRGESNFSGGIVPPYYSIRGFNTDCPEIVKTNKKNAST